jgi:hypothetical protein
MEGTASLTTGEQDQHDHRDGRPWCR